MRKTTMTLMAALLAAPMWAQVTPLGGFYYGQMPAPTGWEWQSPDSVAYNKQQPHAWFFSFENVEQARKVLGGVQLFLWCGDQPLLDIIAYHRACQRRLPQYCQVGIDIAHHLFQIKADVRNLRIAGQTEFLNVHSCVLPFIFYASIIYDFGQ